MKVRNAKYKELFGAAYTTSIHLFRRVCAQATVSKYMSSAGWEHDKVCMYAMRALATLILDGDNRQILKIFSVAADQWARFASSKDVVRGLALDEQEQLDLVHILLLARPIESTARPKDPSEFSSHNNANHFHNALIAASVYGPLLTRKAIELDAATVAKIGPICSRHEVHPRLVLPLSKDLYWSHYLPAHAGLFSAWP